MSEDWHLNDAIRRFLKTLRPSWPAEKNVLPAECLLRTWGKGEVRRPLTHHPQGGGGAGGGGITL